MIREKSQTIGLRNIDNDTFPAGAHVLGEYSGEKHSGAASVVKLNMLNLRMLLATHFQIYGKQN